MFLDGWAVPELSQLVRNTPTEKTRQQRMGIVLHFIIIFLIIESPAYYVFPQSESGELSQAYLGGGQDSLCIFEYRRD